MSFFQWATYWFGEKGPWLVLAIICISILTPLLLVAFELITSILAEE